MEYKEISENMHRINIIDNIVLGGNGLCAVGRMGYPTKIFIKQGTLDGACGVYCLMMVLMIHRMINREDLTYENCHDDPPYIKRLKKLFLYSLRGIDSGGSTLYELRKKLLKVFDGQIPANVYMASNIDKEGINAMVLRSKIKEQLDAGLPVLLRYNLPNKNSGHAVVAIGYTMNDDMLRLYCLDPSSNLSWSSIWNNVIDVNMDKNDEQCSDYNHLTESKVDVNGILLIEENNEFDSRLPF